MAGQYRLAGVLLVAAHAAGLAAPSPGAAPSAHAGQSAPVRPLRVAAASSMAGVLEALRAPFLEETGRDWVVIAGASGALAAQVRNGAPFDVFVSADMKYPESLAERGHGAAPPVLYAYGRLVFWTAREEGFPAGLAAVADGRVRRIAIPDPEVAPYGRAAVQVLEKRGLLAAARAKLVYGGNVLQAAQFVASRAADVGFTARSVVLSPGMRGRGRWEDISEEDHEPIAQGFLVLGRGAARDPDGCARFAAFMRSRVARGILEAYGYRAP